MLFYRLLEKTILAFTDRHTEGRLRVEKCQDQYAKRDLQSSASGPALRGPAEAEDCRSGGGGLRVGGLSVSPRWRR